MRPVERTRKGKKISIIVLGQSILLSIVSPKCLGYLANYFLKSNIFKKNSEGAWVKLEFFRFFMKKFDKNFFLEKIARFRFAGQCRKIFFLVLGQFASIHGGYVIFILSTYDPVYCSH